MLATLECRVWHLSLNLSLLHLLVTPRLGAMRGGSGSADRRMKLMARRAVVTRWYQATNITLIPFTPTDPSEMSVWWTSLLDMISTVPCNIWAPSILTVLPSQLLLSCWTFITWLLPPGTRRVELREETGYIQQFSSALVGLQGYLCVRDLSREDDIYLSMTNTYNWQGQARQNVIMLYLGDLSYNFILWMVLITSNPCK